MPPWKLCVELLISSNLKFSLDVKNPTFSILEAEAININGTYNNKRLFFENFVGYTKTGEYYAEGYIPIDLDVNLFELTDIESFHKILTSFVNQNTYDAIFPISSPNYYDIFALRAKGWHNLNSSLLIHKIKKVIFKWQWLIQKIK